ncbi:MAG: chemotaxis protein CheW [Lysobacterales bacterium]
MLALAFRLGTTRYALRARDVVEVLPRRLLRDLPAAPAGIVGLLAYRGTLTPVVDLCRILLDRNCAPRRSTRIVIVVLPDGDQTRWVGLLAEQVLDFIDVNATLPGLRLPATPWLGEHVGDAPESPQLLDPGALLPEALQQLFVREAVA